VQFEPDHQLLVLATIASDEQSLHAELTMERVKGETLLGVASMPGPGRGSTDRR